MTDQSAKTQNVDLELEIQRLSLEEGKLVITPDDFDSLLEQSGTIPSATDFSPSIDEIETTVGAKFRELTQLYAQARSFNTRKKINNLRKRIVLFLLWIEDSDEVTTMTRRAIDTFLKENVDIREVTIDDSTDGIDEVTESVPN